MPVAADQRELALSVLNQGEDLVVLVVREGASATVVTRPAFVHPGAYGVLLADMVMHAANAYAHVGYDGASVRNEILSTMGAVLDFPAAHPVAVQNAMRDVPRA
jgi:hypothetical protein